MTLQEALSILGIEAGLDPKAVRRAYLRALKQHPPERDPSGFERVRAAFECAQHASSFQELEEPAAPSTPRGFARAPEDALRHVPRDLRPEPLAPFLDRLEGVTDHAARVAIAREAVDQLASATAYSLWISMLDDGEHDDDVEGAMRSAIAQGHDSFLPELRERLPERLDDGELRAWADSEHGASEFTTIASQWLERAQPQAAAHCLIAGYQRLAREPFAPRPVAWFAPGLVLGLVQQKLLAEARRVLDAFESAYEPSMRGDPVRLAAARELLHVYPELDSQLAGEITAALRAGRPESADHEAKACARYSSQLAQAQARLLREKAPILAGFYASTLEQRQDGQWTFPKLRIDWMTMWGFLVVARLLTTFACDHDESSSLRPPVQVAAPAEFVHD